MTRTRMLLAVAAAWGAAVASGASTQPVSYFDARQVRAAFDRGAVLFDRGTNDTVHASRREQAGQAEVHTLDTDVI